MIANCRNCGTFLLTADEAHAVSLRLGSLLDPPTCPRCDDEIRSSAFQPAICLFCKQVVLADDGGELVQTTDGDEPAHGTCVSKAEEHEAYLRDNAGYLSALASGWAD